MTPAALRRLVLLFVRLFLDLGVICHGALLPDVVVCRNSSSPSRFWLVFKVHFGNKDALVPSNVFGSCPNKCHGKMPWSQQCSLPRSVCIIICCMTFPQEEADFVFFLFYVNKRWLPAVFDG